MFWLGLGTTLLLWAATGSPGKRRMDWVARLCAGLIAIGAALSLRLYADLAVALIVAGAIGAALALRRFRLVPTQGVRWASVLIGAAALAFALFGPAEGLF